MRRTMQKIFNNNFIIHYLVSFSITFVINTIAFNAISIARTIVFSCPDHFKAPMYLVGFLQFCFYHNTIVFNAISYAGTKVFSCPNHLKTHIHTHDHMGEKLFCRYHCTYMITCLMCYVKQLSNTVSTV